MQQTGLFQSFIFLWFLALGQAIPIDETKRAGFFCCTFGLDYTRSIDTCFEWNNCEGGYTACTTNAVEASICSQCLEDPLKDYCQIPITQGKRDLDSGHLDFHSEHAIIPREATPPIVDLVPRVTNTYIHRLPAVAGTTVVKYVGVTFNFLIDQALDVFLEVVNNNGHAIIAEVYKMASGAVAYTTEDIQLGNGASSNWQSVGVEKEKAATTPGGSATQPFGFHPNDIVTLKIRSPG